MNQKVFSIIIATYNCGRKIEPTIQSILSQNKDLFELIIIDGASTDDTLEYIKKYENDLKLISEKDDGIYYAFNKGIDLATGKYLYFIGAGDILREGVLERVNKALPSENPAFVYGDVYLKEKQLYERGARSNLNFAARLICHQTIFYHRNIFQLIGKYDLQYKILADLAFNFKCFGNRQIKKHYIECVVADFEEGGISSTMEDSNFRKDLPRLIKNNLGMKSYIYYKADAISFDIYWKLYFPFVRPYISAVKRLKDSSSS
ncbi:MAG TPA: glycosyltransferase family 2 protein [Pyrinomonadaceae bacterium]|nr:glycosyltransferase family 2 protein [Pyrinomonadaceae bacterium]